MNQELRQPYEQLVQAYNQLPEAWTRRFERMEGEDSVVLRHRSVNLNIELSPLPGIPLRCVPGCSEPEHITYFPVARFQASLYAPLENTASPEEGIEALRTLQQQEQRLNLSLPTFRRDQQFVFGHYESGVEYTIDISRIRLEIPLIFLPEHNLPDLIRTFSFIPYNFNLDVNAEPPYHPETEEFGRQAKEYLQGYEERNKIVDCPEFVDKLIANYGIFPAGEYDAVWHDPNYPAEKYNSAFRGRLGNMLAEQIWPIHHVLNGELSKKRILDLGCGSRGGTEDSRDCPMMYEPWLCRALLELGASPIGIDIGRLQGEKFEHYRLNLLSPDSLSFLGNNSVDVAHVGGGLFSSPTGYTMDGFENLRAFLIPQLERIVKPDGYFIETI